MSYRTNPQRVNRVIHINAPRRPAGLPSAFRCATCGILVPIRLDAIGLTHHLYEHPALYCTMACERNAPLEHLRVSS